MPEQPSQRPARPPGACRNGWYQPAPRVKGIEPCPRCNPRRRSQTDGCDFVRGDDPAGGVGGVPLPEPAPTDAPGTFIVRDPASGIIYSLVDGAVVTTPDCRCWELRDGRWVEDVPWAPRPAGR